jgi:hypothetical protein
MTGIGGNFSDHEPHQDDRAIVDLLVKELPLPFLNSPIVGWLIVPLPTPEKLRLHCRLSGL